jgi:hypothetical protein
MTDITSNLTPNADLAQGCFDSPIRIDSINITDIRVDQPFNNTIQSMIDTGVESIADIDLEIIGNDTTLKAE